MKKLTIVCLLLFSVFTSADNRKPQQKNEHKNGYKEDRKHKPEVVKNAFDVLPLNSPVKESTANFLIKVNGSLEIEEVMYKIKNAGKIFEKPTNFQKAVLSNGPEGKVLKVNVSKLNPGFYQLFVKIKDKKRNEHFFKTKYKDHAMFVIDSSLEVPMPDPKKNNATIAGIDSDNDGIRDDVQRWINMNLSNKPVELKLAFKQYAIAMQSSLTISHDKQASILTTHEKLKALGCVYGVNKILEAPSAEQAQIRKKIKLLFLNTKNRIEASLKTSENFHGQEVSTLSKEEACNF